MSFSIPNTEGRTPRVARGDITHKENPKALILIEGHCDERGTDEYNLALGERRAEATRAYLASRGIAGTRMTIISYGEERATCTQRTEECWSENRRSHVDKD